MAPKHLRELLVEDQEPFFLDDYISERRRQLNMPPGPVIHRKFSSIGDSFLDACFSPSSPFPYSHPKSPVPFPPKSGTASAHNTVLVVSLKVGNGGLKGHDLPEGKRLGKSAAGNRTLESLLRKLKKLGTGRHSRNKDFSPSKGREGVLVRDILGWNNLSTNANKTQDSCGPSCGHGTSQSSDTRSVSEREEVWNPMKVVAKSSSRCCNPELQSAAESLCHSALEDKQDFVESNQLGIWRDRIAEDGTYDKKQSSPVSVLEPPLCDDDAEERDDYRLEYTGDGFNHESGRERTNQMLLRKLAMFEKQLMGIDPVKLEEPMAERLGESGLPDARWMRVGDGMAKMAADIVVVRKEEMGWRDEEVDQSLEDTAGEIELAILGFLLEEFFS
ncbi:hypothetical protein MLD38_016126 [Melastoma candidum]|uniref:Uncharacterized protein n=1 Tax=Melastoma candidum TaxID=119954 RepID=A0ACB9RLH7_9MYRT|nr:hypothetical protein MLD38_016126 [Melastoma candidum]